MMEEDEDEKMRKGKKEEKKKRRQDEKTTRGKRKTRLENGKLGANRMWLGHFLEKFRRIPTLSTYWLAPRPYSVLPVQYL